MLLALDTSTAQVGLGLFDGTQVLAESTWHSSLRHTQELAPALAELLRRAELKVDQIEAIGVATGPGSFTSLRVGLSFAKGMALARHIPLIGIPSLDVTAAGVPLADLRPHCRCSGGARPSGHSPLQARRKRVGFRNNSRGRHRRGTRR